MSMFEESRMTARNILSGLGTPADGDTLVAGGGRYASAPHDMFADGSDGSATTSGALSEARDMFRGDWTWLAGCAVNTNGWREFIAGNWDTTQASTGALYCLATPGNDASGVTAGAAVGPSTLDPVGTGSINLYVAQVAGRSGTTAAAGTAGLASVTAGITLGGPAGVAGAGGAGSSGAGGAAGTNNPTPQRFVATRSLSLGLIASAQSYRGGESAPSGGSGGGDAGGGGGGSGSPGAPGTVIGIFARKLIVSSSNSATGIIQVKGAKGGKGGTPPGSTTGRGGGSGAPGSGGGHVLIVVGGVSGSTQANAIDVSGGPGGDAGLGVGAAGVNGTAGGAGYGGSFCMHNFSKTTPQTIVTVVTRYTVGGNAPVGTVGGTSTPALIDLAAA